MAFDLGVKVLEWDQFSHFVKTHYILEMFSTPTHIACSFIINEKKKFQYVLVIRFILASTQFYIYFTCYKCILTVIHFYQSKKCT